MRFFPMKRLLFTVFTLFLVAGCGPRNTEYYAYTDSGMEKPRVAIVPIIDSTGVKHPWDVSDEIIFGLRRHICNCGKLYPLPQADVNANAALLGNVDYFGTNLTPWNGFSNAHYVVLIELIDHKVDSYEKGKFNSLYPTNGAHCNEVLAMRAHIRIIDIQHNKARLVLDEILESNHLLPWGHDNVDYESNPWDTENYVNTPVGLAHNRLIWHISQRLDIVIGDCR